MALLLTLYEVVYLVAFYGGWTLVFCLIYPSIDASHQVASRHKVYGILVFGACIASWVIVKYLSSPGEITSETRAQFNHYSDAAHPRENVDPSLETINATTSTGSTTSPSSVPSLLLLPRSKFHRGRYIPRFDHHCYILNRPIGECNYRYFLLLVLLHTGMCWYGSSIVFRLVWEDVQLAHGDTMSLVRKPLTWMTVLPRWICMMYQDVLGTVLAMMLGILAAALTAFLLFHVYLIATNTTTFEFFQRRKQQQQQRQRQQGRLKQSRRIRSITQRSSSSHEQTRNSSIQSKPRQRPLPDEESPLTSSSSSTTNRGISKKQYAPISIPPKNIYNRGLFSNIGEVLYPRCYRRTTSHERKFD